MIEILTAVLLVLGTLFAVTAALGLVRLPDFYTRLHAPTKATTLGAILVLTAALVYFSFGQQQFSIRQLLAILFLFLTSPIGSHMLAKAGRATNLPTHKHTTIEPPPPGTAP